MSLDKSAGGEVGLTVEADGWRRVTPSPSAQELKAFYAGEYFQASHGTYAQAYSKTEIEHRNLLAQLMLAGVAQARGGASGGALLEIGCGEGWLLSAAAAAGYAVQGLDFSQAGLAKFHPQFLDRARFGDAFEILDSLIEAGEKADVCVMEHVLEHVVDPQALLQRLPRLLSPGGVLAITVPNDFSPLQIAARAEGAIDRDVWLAPPQHLNYFNAASLAPFLARMGFELKLGFASFPIDWFLMHPGSNYVADPAAGKAAHRARLAIDLILAEQEMEAYLGLAKALYACGAGRSLTVIASQKGRLTMQVRYIANACFLITLSTGETLLTDPWFDGPCQQTWWNFPPVPEALKAQVWASSPDLIYISHLHHDHLHPQTLEPFDKATPVVIGKLNTPNLKNALRAVGFTNVSEVPFETRTPIGRGGCEAVIFKDFHGNTRGDETQVDYDLDTSLYLYDADGTRLFNAVDNTILPPDAARIAAQYGPPDIAMLPYASASLYPMGMGDYDAAAKTAAMTALRERTGRNFRENVRALGAKRVIPAGGEYVLGGQAAGLSRFLPQPLASELAMALASIGQEEVLAKLYPGDVLNGVTLAVTKDRRASHRDFTDAERSAYALTLADRTASFAQTVLPADLAFDWSRALKKCAANYAARRAKMGLELAADIYLDARGPGGLRTLLFKFATDHDQAGLATEIAKSDRARLVYELDERLLFNLITALLSWNAMEASALITLRRAPDVYMHDVHRSIVHFTLLS